MPSRERILRSIAIGKLFRGIELPTTKDIRRVAELIGIHESTVRADLQLYRTAERAAAVLYQELLRTKSEPDPHPNLVRCSTPGCTSYDVRMVQRRQRRNTFDTQAVPLCAMCRRRAIGLFRCVDRKKDGKLIRGQVAFVREDGKLREAFVDNMRFWCWRTKKEQDQPG